MATFAVIAQHPPELCPTSNAQTREMLKQGAAQIPKLAEQLGVGIVTYSLEEAVDLSNVLDPIF
jgi:hypothetical protein